MAATKDRLMISGLKLYAQKGLNGVTMDDILLDSHVKKGSFYHFFHHKDELLEAALTQYFLPIIVKRFEAFKKSPLPFRELIEHFYLDMVSDTNKMLFEFTGCDEIQPRDIGLLLLENIRACKFASASFKTNQRKIRDAIIEKIVVEQQKKNLPSTIESSEIATLIITCGEGALYLSSWNSSLYCNEEILEISFRHLWTYLDLLMGSGI